jgi:hypothetical protein
MNVQLKSSLAGERFSFRPGKVITCSNAQGQRLIDEGLATVAPEEMKSDGKLPSSGKELEPEVAGTPKSVPGPVQSLAAARGRAQGEDGKAKSDPKGNPLNGPRTRQTPERAIAPGSETPEAGAPVAHCTGETKKGNPCPRAPLPGSERCAWHPLAY